MGEPGCDHLFSSGYGRRSDKLGEETATSSFGGLYFGRGVSVGRDTRRLWADTAEESSSVIVGSLEPASLASMSGSLGIASFMIV